MKFPLFQDILSRTSTNASLPWYKTLREYYFRPEWELFDLKFDPQEEFNVAEKQSYQVILISLKIAFYLSKVNDQIMNLNQNLRLLK